MSADPVASRPPTRVTLQWRQNLVFTAASGERSIVTDGDGREGLTPVELLGAALAGCMGTDVALILTRGRQPLRALDVELTADRANEEPRRFTRVHVHFGVRGDVNPEQLERAIRLSHEKYCSVWHTLRQDLPLELTSSITPE
jgi:putative redox protein